jgi:hypothetical protein
MEEFLSAAAAALWGATWASEAEEQGENLGGVDVMDVMPPVPKQAAMAAAELMGAYEYVNKTAINRLWVKAATAPGKHYDGPTVELFGHYLAMAAMGHGVSWFDDHPNVPMKVPHMEFHVFYDEDDEKYVVDHWEV